MDDDITPININDDNAPFGGPDPDEDDAVSTRPETDSDIDEQELYDEGLAGAAELDEDEMDDDDDIPDGFHIE
jgi:hypothetical protein